jgi:hypothetical protein
LLLVTSWLPPTPGDSVRRAVISVLITSCAALLAGCSSGEIDANGDTPHTAASEAGFTPTPPPSAEPFPGTGDLVSKSVGNAAKHADRSGFSLDFMTYAHGSWAAGYEINIYTYNEDHAVSSVTDLSSIARHKDGSDAGSGDRFGHAAWRAGAVMTISNSTGVSRPSEVCLRRRW